MTSLAATSVPTFTKADVMPAIEAFIASLGLDYFVFPDEDRDGLNFAYGHTEADTVGWALRVSGSVSHYRTGIDFTVYAMQVLEEGAAPTYMQTLVTPDGEYLSNSTSWTTEAKPCDYNLPAKSMHPRFLDAVKHTFALNLAAHKQEKATEAKIAALREEFGADAKGKFAGENYEAEVLTYRSQAMVRLSVTTEDPAKVKAILAILNQNS